MAPPNTDTTAQEFEKVDIRELARTKGHYLVYPEKKVMRFHFLLTT